MRRILLVLSVALVIVAMLLASAMPAFAAPKNEGAPNCQRGLDEAFFGPGAENRNEQSTETNNRVFFERCVVLGQG